MKNIEKCLLVAGELRERARSHGPLSRRARMIILAERLEAVTGAPERSDDASDPVQLALSACARMTVENSDRTRRDLRQHW